MIGYQAYATPQAAFVSLYTNAALTTFAKEIATLYVPEITRVDTTACCSDHQSFYEVGYPSVGLVEGGGYTIDPKYHNVGSSFLYFLSFFFLFFERNYLYIYKI